MMWNELVNVVILNAVVGAAYRIYHHEGRNFISVKPGDKYAVQVKNNGTGRIEVLMSVDGLDVLEERPASFSNPGMVIDRSWYNRGWRVSDNHVREFVFGTPSESVAAMSIGTANVGVIGVAVFRERRVYPTIRSDFVSKSMFDQARFSGAALSAADLGTGMGDKIEDRVGHTDFRRDQPMPDYVYEIQYRTEKWLIDNGIVKPGMPSAFPDSMNSTGYARYRGD